jgi:hypothetical protein
LEWAGRKSERIKRREENKTYGKVVLNEATNAGVFNRQSSV